MFKNNCLILSPIYVNIYICVSTSNKMFNYNFKFK